MNEMKEFENSFKGLMNIIKSRKLYRKKPYLISGIIILVLNIIIFCIHKCTNINIDYLKILTVFVGTFSSAFITFCGFTMTAYSLVVGFLNYGVFKPTIDKWFKKKIEISQGKSDEQIPIFSLYQNGIALFAFSILVLLLTVVILLIIKFTIEIDIEIDWEYIYIFNALILFIITLLTTFSLILMFFNIVNIFTFSQALNELVYTEELEKIKKEDEKVHK